MMGNKARPLRSIECDCINLVSLIKSLKEVICLCLDVMFVDK